MYWAIHNLISIASPLYFHPFSLILICLIIWIEEKEGYPVKNFRSVIEETIHFVQWKNLITFTKKHISINPSAGRFLPQWKFGVMWRQTFQFFGNNRNQFKWFWYVSVVIFIASSDWVEKYQIGKVFQKIEFRSFWKSFENVDYIATNQCLRTHQY